MAITTKEELVARALQLVPEDTEHYDVEKVSKLVWQEMKTGGLELSNEELAQALREAYDEPFWTVKYVEEIKQRFNLS